MLGSTKEINFRRLIQCVLSGGENPKEVPEEKILRRFWRRKSCGGSGCTTQDSTGDFSLSRGLMVPGSTKEIHFQRLTLQLPALPQEKIPRRCRLNCSRLDRSFLSSVRSDSPKKHKRIQLPKAHAPRGENPEEVQAALLKTSHVISLLREVS